MDTNLCSSLRSGCPSVRYLECPCSCCHLAAASRQLQLEGNASLLEKDSSQIPIDMSLFPPPLFASQGATFAATAFSPFPTSPGDRKSAVPVMRSKTGICILLVFSGQVLTQSF